MPPKTTSKKGGAKKGKTGKSAENPEDFLANLAAAEKKKKAKSKEAKSAAKSSGMSVAELKALRINVVVSIASIGTIEVALTKKKNSTVLDVKARLEAVHGIPILSQTLLLSNDEEPLDDPSTMDDLKVAGGATLRCLVSDVSLNSWAGFAHFCSTDKQNKHCEFTDDAKVVTKTGISSSPTYVFNAGSLNANKGALTKAWTLKILKLTPNAKTKPNEMNIGLFQGRMLRIDLHPWADASSSFKLSSDSKRCNTGGNLDASGSSKGSGRIATQSPMWLVSNSGKFKEPAESGNIWATTALSHKARAGQAFVEGDVVTICVSPQDREARFFLNGTSKYDHVCSLPLGEDEVNLDDLHLVATLQTTGDSIDIQACGEFVATEGAAPDLTKLLDAEGEAPAWAGSAERMLKEMGFSSFEERDAWSKAEEQKKKKKDAGASEAAKPPEAPA
jgi:hypothetical protein